MHEAGTLVRYGHTFSHVIGETPNEVTFDWFVLAAAGKKVILASWRLPSRCNRGRGTVDGAIDRARELVILKAFPDDTLGDVRSCEGSSDCGDREINLLAVQSIRDQSSGKGRGASRASGSGQVGAVVIATYLHCKPTGCKRAGPVKESQFLKVFRILMLHIVTPHSLPEAI